MSEFKLLGEEVEREIVIIQQALSLKSLQLDEAKGKLRKEIVEHQIVKNCLDKNINEMKDLKKELDICLKASMKVEEENAKYRESIAKLQTQLDSSLKERHLLIERCHNSDIEICGMKSEIADLKDKLEEHLTYKEHYDQYQSDMRNFIEQIMRTQETLSKEQARLKKTVQDGAAFATQLSEELNIQSLFVKEANITRITLESETLRLLGLLEEERREKDKLLQIMSREEPKGHYLDDWKISQEEMNKRIQALTEENKKLEEEVETLRTQLDQLLVEKNNSIQIVS